MFYSQISLERSGAPRATEVLAQEFLDQISPEGHIFIGRVGGITGGIRASRFNARFEMLDFRQMAHPSHRWTYREGTLVDEPTRITSSSSSSYSLREIIPEREPIPVIDLSDDESVEGPEMAPVAPGIGPGTSIEEDPSEPMSDSEMTPEPEREAPAVTGSMGTSVANTMPAAASPTPIPPVASISSFPALPSLPSLLRGGVREYDICASYSVERGDLPNGRLILCGTPGTATGDGEGRHVREGVSPDAGGSCSPREREILELIIERDWLRQFIAQFLGTTRDSVDRARDELESRPGCSGSQCP
ncbi:hypothetical protein M9H77_14096 [Catharanthus roseus]|uniref:Uncharacterized protein n=1 Tax=Catharanthus roseus TaxID=4058 RepID=A0ACC0BM20_CATRO|nr:hypothetical protein M9H77_14096 [Catharanthus roseus]